MTINKVVRLGTGEYGPIFCKIKYDGGRLSISGVEGPLRNGDSNGSCGQIVMSRPTITTPAPGWTPGLIGRFWETWDRWHLNDMRAGCEHQRTIDTTEKVEVVEYGLTTEAHHRRRDVIERIAQGWANGNVVHPDETERALILLADWYKPRHSPPDADSPLSGCYEVEKREQKAIGWTYPTEHPRGLLMKPCEVCGYKYGSKWLFEAVPDDVVEFLGSLPDTDMAPAWV